MERKTTDRGFPYYEFKDAYDKGCSLQLSSIATYRAVWLGIDDADPKILASKVVEGGTGWVKYPIHEDVHFTTRMHLDVDQCKSLIEKLQLFVDTEDL